MMRRLSSLVVPLLSLFLSHAAEAQSPALYWYKKVDVPIEGAAYAEITGINDAGTLCGHFYDGQATHGFVMERGSATQLDVPLPGITNTLPSAINGRGDVAGIYRQGDAVHGFVREDGVYRTVDVPFPDAVETRVFGLNAHGTVVGTYYDAQSRAHGFALERGTYRAIEVDLPGAVRTTVNGINDQGTIVGEFADDTGQHGFVLEAGRFRLLDAPDELYGSRVVAINSRGQMLVYGNAYAYLYTRGRFAALPCFLTAYLGSLDGPQCTPQTGLNALDARGRVVGFAGGPGFGGVVGYRFGIIGAPIF